MNTRDDVPFKTEFKPAMKVLSRKPTAKTANPSDPMLGINRLALNEDDDDDDDDDTKKNIMTAQERQQKAQRDREEKQRKYEEARERLFGADTTDGKKTPGSSTPPKQRIDGDSRRQSRSRGENSRPLSSAGSKNRQLYDPSYAIKPDSTYIQKRDGSNDLGRVTPSEQLPIRSPKGPDREGFGFAPRGGRVM